MKLELHKFVGAGLPNVFLRGGVRFEGVGEDRTIAYSDLGGLYSAITRALALCTGPMHAHELRFLRKRMNYSQSDVARLGGKTEQAVAKWEKGITPVPKAEASLLRVAVLSRFGSRPELARAVAALLSDSPSVDCTSLVFVFNGAAWVQNEQLAQAHERKLAKPLATAAIEHAIFTSSAHVKYTADAPSDSPIIMNDYFDGGIATTA